MLLVAALMAAARAASRSRPRTSSVSSLTSGELASPFTPRRANCAGDSRRPVAPTAARASAHRSLWYRPRGYAAPATRAIRAALFMVLFLPSWILVGAL